ncbi:MAG: toll/interleukin-1 receptor domain-containing protein, partial [Candidatus Kapaibacterium sp.]
MLRLSMNPGIFISYSRQDEKQAMHLLSVLRREGYTVWIDQESIAGASIWSDEIVQNIKQSEIFIALLSESSTSSHNVSKEIAIAAENRKIILPIEIGTVKLPGQLEYALAGIQRTNYHDEQAILHAVKNLVARLEGSTTESSTLPTQRARRQRLRLKILSAFAIVLLLAGGFFFFSRNSSEKEIRSNTVIVLPFVEMNLDQDSIRNLDVFSDAIMKRLSTLTTLISAGPSVSSPYKNSRLNPLAIAKE